MVTYVNNYLEGPAAALNLLHDARSLTSIESVIYITNDVWIENDYLTNTRSGLLQWEALLTWPLSSNSSCHRGWDANLLIQETEENIGRRDDRHPSHVLEFR